MAQFDQAISGSTNNSVDEGEAHIAIDPNDSSKMIVGYMETEAGYVNFKIYHSEDGGNSWNSSSFDPVSQLSDSIPTHSLIGGGDIVFAYDKNSKLYCSWITLFANLNLSNPLDTCLWKATWATSNNNGASFSLEANDEKYFAQGKISLNNGSLDVYDFEDGIADRQWMSVDLSNGIYQNNLYVGYINYPSAITNTGLKVKVKNGGNNQFGSESVAYSGNGHFTNISTDNNGVLHYTFADIQQNKILHVSSNDGGQTFSSPNTIYNGSDLFPSNAANHKINERENAAPSFAIDGDNNLHLVWNDFLPNELQPTSFYSRSTNGGLNWSTPLILDTIFPGNVFMPTVSAFGNRVSIGGNVLNDNDSSEYYIILSSNGGQSFNASAKLSSGITDFNAIGLSVFVGDYSSAARTACTIYNLWTDCRSNGCKQYIAKYNECEHLNVVELTPIDSDFSINVYPTITDNIVNVELESETTGNFEFAIYSLNGNKVFEKVYTAKSGTSTYEIGVPNLTSGAYLLMVSDQKNTITTRRFFKN
ncbi:MAG: T9SS type A sorting domain-containing protein [Crocinitomicaceae bacterium]|nr:T9SS type A sorting domain-containing protein [Crocinitomicaceae bacterium]